MLFGYVLFSKSPKQHFFPSHTGKDERHEGFIGKPYPSLRLAKVLMEPPIEIEPTTYSFRINVVDITLRFIWSKFAILQISTKKQPRR